MIKGCSSQCCGLLALGSKDPLPEAPGAAEMSPEQEKDAPVSEENTFGQFALK